MNAKLLAMNQVVVAQIFNLLYRLPAPRLRQAGRFAIGSASANPNAPDHADVVQDAILRYGRLQICATPRSLRFMVRMHAGMAWWLPMNLEGRRPRRPKALDRLGAPLADSEDLVPPGTGS